MPVCLFSLFSFSLIYKLYINYVNINYINYILIFFVPREFVKEFQKEEVGHPGIEKTVSWLAKEGVYQDLKIILKRVDNC